MIKFTAALLAAGIPLSMGVSTSHVGVASHKITPISQQNIQKDIKKSDKLTTADMLSNCVDQLASGGYEVDTDFFSYAFYYGTPDRLNSYTDFVNEEDISKDQLKSAKTLVKRELSKSIQGESPILKLVAKQNMTLKITSDSDASHNNYICWSPDAYYEYLVEGEATSGTVYRLSLDRRFANVDATANSYAMEITLKAGDCFMFLFGSDYITAKQTNRWLTFEATDEYDPTLRPDYDAMEKVVTLRAQKQEEISTLVKSITTKAGYSADTVKAANAAANDAPRRFARTVSEQEVMEVYFSLLASLESAKRLTKSNNALDTTITDSTQKLTNLLISLDATKYAAVYEEIEALYEEGMKKIQEANTPVRAEYQYSVYQNKIYTLLFACENGGQS